MMTRDFFQRLGSSCGGSGNGRAEYLNLKVAANMMGVTKCRLYNIVNVMEGVGAVDRPKIILVAWSGDDARTVVMNTVSYTTE